jgi:hypothetical protein
MPVLANNVSLTAGSSSVNIFDNTNYQFVNEGTELRVSAAVVGAADRDWETLFANTGMLLHL